MPTEYKVYTQMLKTIESIQKSIKSSAFQSLSDDGKRNLYASVFGARYAANAERNKKSTLKGTVSAQEFEQKRNALIQCPTFQTFINRTVENDPDGMKRLLTQGHGGALEDAFKDYVKNMDRIPSDVPKAYMPTALERTEILQKKIKSSAFQSKNMYEQNLIYKELVATRAAVEAIRGSKKSLDVPIDAEKLGEARNQLYAKGGADSFFDEASRTILKDAAVAGHGGALEDKLKADLLLQAAVDGVVPEAPARYQPTSAQLRERIQQELASELKVPNNSAFDTEKEITMKKVAGMM